MQIESIINKGLLVSDNIINDLVSKILLNKKYINKLIFDGYPRNLHQAKDLDLLIKKNNITISRVLSLNVDKKTIIKRVSGREICSNCGLIFNKFYKPSVNPDHTCDIKFITKRLDDNEETASKRFDTYHEKTLPILEFYKKQNLLSEINGDDEITSIYGQIEGIIGALET